MPVGTNPGHQSSWLPPASRRSCAVPPVSPRSAPTAAAGHRQVDIGERSALSPPSRLANSGTKTMRTFHTGAASAATSRRVWARAELFECA